MDIKVEFFLEDKEEVKGLEMKNKVIGFLFLMALAIGIGARQMQTNDQWRCADEALSKVQSGVAKRSEAQTMVYAEELMLCFKPAHVSYKLGYTIGAKNVIEVDKTAYKVGQDIYASVSYKPWKHQIGGPAMFDREVKGLVVLYTGEDYKFMSVDMTSYVQRQMSSPEGWHPLRSMSGEVEGSRKFGGSARTLMFEEGDKIRDHIKEEHVAVSRGFWNIKELVQSHDVNLVIADAEEFSGNEVVLRVRAQIRIWATDRGMRYTVDGDYNDCHTCRTPELERFFRIDLA